MDRLAHFSPHAARFPSRMCNWTRSRSRKRFCDCSGTLGRADMLTLVMRSIGRVSRLLIAVLGLLVAFQFVLIAVAASFTGADAFTRLAEATPQFLQMTFGAGLASFGGMATLGYF